MRAGSAQAPHLHPAAHTARTVSRRQSKAGEARQSDNISEVHPGELTKACESPGPAFDRRVDDGYKVRYVFFCRPMV